MAAPPRPNRLGRPRVPPGAQTPGWSSNVVTIRRRSSTCSRLPASERQRAAASSTCSCLPASEPTTLPPRRRHVPVCQRQSRQHCRRRRRHVPAASVGATTCRRRRRHVPVCQRRSDNLPPRRRHVPVCQRRSDNLPPRRRHVPVCQRRSDNWPTAPGALLVVAPTLAGGLRPVLPPPGSRRLSRSLTALRRLQTLNRGLHHRNRHDRRRFARNNDAFGARIDRRRAIVVGVRARCRSDAGRVDTPLTARRPLVVARTLAESVSSSQAGRHPSYTPTLGTEKGHRSAPFRHKTA